MNSIVAHTKMELKLYFRETLAILFTLIVPAASFIVFGFMFESQTYDGLDYFQAYIPGMLSIIIFTTAFFSMGLQIVIDREKGVYKRLKGTPIHQHAIFTATIIKGFFAIYIGTLEILFIAKLVFKANLTHYPFQFFIALTLCSISFFALGFVICSLAKRMQTALGIAMVSMYPMLFLSGATLPLDVLPNFLQITAKFIPLTYVVNSLRDGWNGLFFTSSALFDTSILLGILIISSGIGVKLFRWTN